MIDRSNVRERLRERILSRRGISIPPSVRVTSAPPVENPPLDDEIVTSLEASDVVGLYLVTESECPGCHEAMEEFMDDILDGTLMVVDVGDEKGFEIVQALGIDRVPQLVVQLKDGRYLEWKQE